MVKILGVKIGLALVLHWAFGVVFGIILHAILELMLEYLKQGIMKVTKKLTDKKIWCGALSEIWLKIPPHDSPLTQR